MSNRYALWSLFAAVLFLFCPLLSADDQNFSISRSTPLFNSQPGIAVNTASGEVLVVWRQKDEDTKESSRIYAALCKPGKNGTYKAGKARLISAKDELSSAPYVAYSTITNKYFVAWRLDRIVDGFSYIDIQGRAVNAKGRAVGKIVELLPRRDLPESMPVLTAVPGATIKAVPEAEFLFCWSGDPGLMAVMLDSAGNMVSTPELVLPELKKTGNYVGIVYPSRAISTEKGSFYLTASRVNQENLGDATQIRETFVVRLDAGGSYAGKVVLEQTEVQQGHYHQTYARIVQLSKRSFLSCWWDNGERVTYNQLLKPTLKTKGNKYVVLDWTYLSDLIPLADGGAVQMNSSPGYIHMFKVDAKGKMQGSPASHIFINHNPLGYVTSAIPGTNKVFVAGGKNLGVVNNKRTVEIIGHVFEVN